MCFDGKKFKRFTPGQIKDTCVFHWYLQCKMLSCDKALERRYSMVCLSYTVSIGLIKGDDRVLRVCTGKARTMDASVGNF